jgi:hypothetical protein
MFKTQRPLVHGDFEPKVSTAKKAVKDAIDRNQNPEFPPAWSDRSFKGEFVTAQHGKCGFCEGLVIGNQYGDIEHFRPKAEVHELVDNPERWGVERRANSTVTDRDTKKPIVKPGYWWRAYDWDNFLLSCLTCNQVWKANLFPVKGARARKDRVPENALLLSPFDKFNPSEHFEYGRLGEIIGTSEQGRATIITCGLDRPSLRLARYQIAVATHTTLDEVADDVSDDIILRGLRAIATNGDPKQIFCGMVQTIFERRTGLPWKKLQHLITVLEKSAA